MRRDCSPALQASSLRLKNVDSAVPSVLVIHSCGCTPVALSLVAMVGMKPSKMVFPVSSDNENASSNVILSPWTPWPATLVTLFGIITLPLANGWRKSPAPRYGRVVIAASGELPSVFRYFLKWSPASLPVCAK